jgi:hypothetical protein
MKPDPELRDLHFEPLKFREGRPVRSVDYNNVYSARLRGAEIRSEDDAMDVLDRLFEIFNIERPGNFKGHSLSVSDVVEFPESHTAYFCDSFGWEKIEDFHKTDSPIGENYFSSSVQAKILEEIRKSGDGEDVTIDGPVLIDKKGVHKVTVNLATGDLKLIVAMFRDYIKGMDEIKRGDVLYEAYYRNKFLDICKRISEPIGYDYDTALERCLKKNAKEDNSDIGEEAISLTVKRAAVQAKKEENAKAEAEKKVKVNPAETMSQFLGRKLLPQ